jgi:hypothetical protein
VKQQQQDLIQVAEQKSYLEAVAKGYGAEKGYNIDEVKTRLKQLEQRENELKNTLKANDAEINYTPRERDPIGPDVESKRLQEEYRARKQALEEEAAQAKADRKRELEEEQSWLEKDMKNKANQAAVWNMLTKGAEYTKWGADIGVNILEKVTGPAGKMIKEVYDVATPMAEATGEAISLIDKESINDPFKLGEDIAKEMVKGSMNSATNFISNKLGGDEAKGLLGETGQKVAGHIFTVGSEGLKGAAEAALDGEDIVDGAIGGAMGGTLDAATSEILDGLIPEGEIPEGVNMGKWGAKDFADDVLKSNGFGREAIKEGLKDEMRDQLGNLVKGEDIGPTGWKQEFTEKVMDDLYKPAVRTAYDYYTK